MKYFLIGISLSIILTHFITINILNKNINGISDVQYEDNLNESNLTFWIKTIFAQEMTTTTIQKQPILLTDTEKLNVITIEKQQTDDLASKYAKLYDSCKNK